MPIPSDISIKQKRTVTKISLYFILILTLLTTFVDEVLVSLSV